jgi:DNA processing protein
MEKKSEKRLMLMALKRVKGFGSRKIINLIEKGTIESTHNTFLKESKDYLNYIDEESKIIDYCSSQKIIIITYLDEIYPEKLKKIRSPPIYLFAKGNLSLLNSQGVSIVGSRKSSQSALDWTSKACKKLVEKDYTIISGGAIGIDKEAHQSTLVNSGKTICVLGCGFDNLYPKENKELFQRIENQGLIITEYSPHKRVNRISLLERNRITSGLGEKLLLVTSDIKGGSMSQLKDGISQNKEIYVPDLSLSLEPISGIKKSIELGQTKSIFEIEDMFKQTHSKITQLNLLSTY